jgi:glycosyltransferase involved in cell wall biosynthesis
MLDNNEDNHYVLIVVDVRGWAFSYVADYIQHALGTGRSRVIYTEDYTSYGNFCDHLTSLNFSCLFFFSRRYLFELINYTALFRLEFGPILAGHRILTTIPDHAFSSPSDLEHYARHFNFIDGYITTSRRLFEHYRDATGIPEPCHVIHDHPYLELSPPETPGSVPGQKELNICWIGNSKWGRQYGLHDYKGLHSIIIPAVNRLKNDFSISFSVYDIDVQKYPKKVIDQALIDADIFVCASVQEGTPLTVVEAMAYGCAIVSTDVGVIPEVFPDEQMKFVVERNADAFYFALYKLCKDHDLLNALAAENIQQYARLYVSDQTDAASWVEVVSGENLKPDGEMARQKKLRILNELTSCLPLSARLCIVNPWLKRSAMIKKLTSGYYKVKSRLGGT